MKGELRKSIKFTTSTKPFLLQIPVDGRQQIEDVRSIPWRGYCVSMFPGETKSEERNSILQENDKVKNMTSEVRLTPKLQAKN